MGAMMKANVPMRLVGAVSNGQSYTATRRRNAQADMLPPKCGAFLYIAGLEMYRFNTFLMDDTDERRAVSMICERWGKSVTTGYGVVTSPVITGYATGYDGATTSKSAPVSVTGYDNQSTFPIGEGRALTPDEAAAVRDLAASGLFDWRGEVSLSALCKHVYGSKETRRLQWIGEALQPQPKPDGKIIQLRKRAS
jgi:hypothetical protein